MRIIFKEVVFAFAFLVINSHSLLAQGNQGVFPKQLTPVNHLLNPDGAINLTTGFKGSLDVKGWRMRSGPNGEPRFAREDNQHNAFHQTAIADTGDDIYWDDRFASPGVLGGQHSVHTLAVIGTDLYVAGDFTSAGGMNVNNIAKWDGTQWSALGSGMNYWVSALAAIGTDLYAGGVFTNAGGVSANAIAKWNGTQWSALRSGMGGVTYPIGVTIAIVYAFVAIGTDLYAGGVFKTADGVSANYIAKWNGTQWSALGSGMNSAVFALAVIGTDLYAGGGFATAGAVSANYIAKWDGTQWSALGSETNSAVNALAVIGMDLYAGGNFTSAGGVNANYIAKWDGTQWSALGSGIEGEGFATPYVRTLAVIGTDLYAGGRFTTAGGVSANAIARWDGTQWLVIGKGGSGMNDWVTALAVIGTDLYAGGGFATAGAVSANYIAKWDGTQWSALGSETNSAVSALAVVGMDLYAGGHFTSAGGVNTNFIAKWDGTQWSALGSGIEGVSSPYVGTLAVIGTDLYAGGRFTTAGGVSANNIAKWNGTQWSALGSGMYYWVAALAVMNSELYAGGDFTTAGGMNVNNIAKWDGIQWSGLGGGMNDGVFALAVIGNELYAGGVFDSADVVSTNRIAKWNGTQWAALGSGLSGPFPNVYALAVMNTDLYAGGDFTSAGRKPSAYIARWFGRTTTAMLQLSAKNIDFGNLKLGFSKDTTVTVTNTGTDTLKVTSITSTRTYFTVRPTVLTIPPGESKPDTIRFTPDSIGVRSALILLTSNALTGTDTITVSGNATSTGVASFGSEIPKSYVLFQNFPNPFNPSTTIRFGVPLRSRVRLTIFDILGQKVGELMDENVEAGYFQKEWHGNIASGIYFCRIQAVALDDPQKRFAETKKLILLR